MADVVSSSEGYAFACYLHEQQINKCETNQQSDENHKTNEEATAATDIVERKYKGRLNYNKWEEMQRKIEKEEENIKKCKEDEMVQQRAAASCSHDHTKERQLYEKTTTEKLKGCCRFKEKGNEAYAQRNYGFAAVQYRQALLQLDYTFPEGEEETTEFNELNLACLLNLAACKLKQKNYEEVINLCTQALRIEATNCKALFRIGVAYSLQDRWDEAEEHLRGALLAAPNNEAVEEELKTLKKKRIDHKKQTSIVCKKIFNSTTPMGTPTSDDVNKVNCTSTEKHEEKETVSPLRGPTNTSLDVLAASNEIKTKMSVDVCLDETAEQQMVETEGEEIRHPMNGVDVDTTSCYRSVATANNDGAIECMTTDVSRDVYTAAAPLIAPEMIGANTKPTSTMCGSYVEKHMLYYGMLIAAVALIMAVVRIIVIEYTSWKLK